MTPSRYTLLHRRLRGGFATNADRELRTTDAEYVADAMAAHDDSLIEQAIHDGQVRAMNATVDDLQPEILDPDTESLSPHGRALAVTSRKAMDVTSWRGKRLKPAAWKPRKSKAEWPWRVLPVGLPPAAWESIVEGWHCIRCCNPLAEQGGDCAHCGLTRELRAEGFAQLEQLSEVSYERPTQHHNDPNITASGIVLAH